MTPRYAAVLFDLFDTLVHFDPNQLPVVEIAGKAVRSSAGRLLPILNGHAPSVTLEACYDALRASWQEAERLRAVDHREVTAPQRMGDMLQRLAVDPSGCPSGFVESMLDAHRAALAEAVQFPEHYRALLRALRPHYRLAVVSNFDYTPTAVGMLRTAGVVDLFDVIVVSDAIGWRKPRPEIFEAALRQLGVAPGDALFVGDRADIDVVGAQRMGMAVAWVNRDRTPLPADIAPPDYEIRDLGELAPVLGVTL
jgi:HAD superfamily hydrolase (TIGR01509 family)